MPSPRKAAEPPATFKIQRELRPGRYPLSEVFPGWEKLASFRSLSKDAEEASVVASTSIELVPEDIWMYVAPREVPPLGRRRGWKPVVSEQDCIVVGRGHLAESPAMVVYLDILHELTHVVQRHHGRELWDPKHAYVDRPTEVEAYEVAVHEARRLGATDAFLRDYLRVEWIDEKDFLRLLRHLSVGTA